MRSDGLHHRFGTVETGVLSTDRPSHLAGDPATGDVVYDVFGTIKRLARDGTVSTIGSVADRGNVTSLDVAADGAVYVAAGPEDIQRIAADGTRTTFLETPQYVEALTVDGDGVVYFSGARLWRVEDGVVTRLAGDGRYCLAPDPCGDGGDALDASFGNVVLLDASPFGDIYLGELFGRVRVVSGGTISAVVGGWIRCAFAPVDCGEGSVGPYTLLDDVVSLAVEEDDLYLVDRRPDGAGARRLSIQGVTAGEGALQGYRMIASDGGVFTFGWSTFHGSTGDIRLVSPIVAGVSNGVDGYWFVAGDGGVFTFGDAGFFGSAAGRTTSPVVDMARTPTGDGYWLLERDGRVHAFGDAPHRGDASPTRTASLAAIIGCRSGDGYRIVRTDGSQADHQCAIGGQPAAFPALNRPIVHARPTPSGNGLWLVASDGGVFTQGDAGFFGSTGNLRLNSPVIDLVPTPDGGGYWLIAADGGVFTFGEARFHGSMGAARLNRPVLAGVAGPVVSG